MRQRFSNLGKNVLFGSVAVLWVCACSNSSDNPGSEGSAGGTGAVGSKTTTAANNGGSTGKSSTTKSASGGAKSTSSKAESKGGSKATSADTEASGGSGSDDVGGSSNSGGKSSKTSGSSKGGSSSSASSSTGGKSSSATGGSEAGGKSSSGGSSNPTGGTTSSDTGPVSCPSTVLKSGDSDKKIQVGSDSRAYILHVPAKYDGTKPVPLVIDFHGITGSGSGERTSSPYPAQTDPDGVIMAFPTGASGPMGNAWNVGPCCVANVDDVAFAKAIVADIEKVACIDPKRVYAVGFSMGGGMSHYLACHAADVFAAVAPAAFDLLKENVDACKPARPISVISFRSTGDSVVSYSGGLSSVVQGMPITFLGAKGTFQKWAELNGCTGSPSAEDSKGCSTYSSCKEGVQVTLCTKQGGQHEPGDASVAWPLLKQHPMP